MSRSFARLRLPFTTLLLLLLLAAPLLLPQTAQAATFTVNSSGDTDDANPGDGTCATSNGDCTLRAALQEANATPDEDTITFETLTAPIVLGGNALSITGTVTINGTNEPLPIIDGDARSPVFEITADANVTLNSLQIQNGRNANEQGGGIINAGTLIINSTIITGNVATQGGGGIFNNGGTVTLRDTQVSSNRTADATGTGGGIRSDGGTITVQGGAVRDNRAGTDGGGIFVNAGQLRLTDTTIAGNQVLAGATNQQRGGGVYYSGGDAVLTNAIIESNTTGQSGGGIHSDDGITIVGGTFRNNTTTKPLAEGGGFWNGGGTVQITDTRFEQNRAESHGGGLFLGTTSVVTLTNIVVTENRADEGAGIFNDRLQDQQAGARTLIVASRIASNRADTSDVGGQSGDGGGIYNNREAFLEIRASEVSGNIAAGDGAGLYNANGATMIVDDVLVSGNQTELVALSGGGQNFVDDEQDGGGIYSLENTTLTVRNSTIRDNVAGGYGGGIARFTVAAELAPSTIITNTIIENNTALGQKQIGNSRPDGGGGLWLGASSVLSDVIIRNNRAPLGGGVILTFEDTTFADVTLINNTAFLTETIAGGQVVRDPQSGIGGGIYFDVEGTSALAINRTLIAGNTAEDLAGGIYATAARLSLTNVTLDGNQSAGEGGAFYKTSVGSDIEGQPRITFTNVTVSDNNASNADATDGLYSEGGYASLTNVLLNNGDGSRNCNVLTRNVAFASLGGNLDSGTSCAFAEQGNTSDLSGVAPLLGALADNGGTTQTRALLPGSPAIDAGISTAEACPPTDQRGITRPQGAACDIGAYEAAGTPPLLATLPDSTADLVIGQADFTQNAAGTNAAGFSGPVDIAFVPDGQIFVGDFKNSRVLVWENLAQLISGAPATFVIGQPDLTTVGPDPFAATGNCFDATRVATERNMCGPESVAVDADRNRLYVTDTYNHRVLMYSLPITANQPAAVRVFGQADFTARGENRTFTETPAADSLYYPRGLAIDVSGNLFVADDFNGRVLVFQDPTAADATAATTADVVLGAANTTTPHKHDQKGAPNSPCEPPTATTLCSPKDVVVTTIGDVFVTDYWNNRVVMYASPLAGGQQANFTADRALGQPVGATNLTSKQMNAPDNTPSAIGMNKPIDMVLDAAGTLFVSDAGNHRVLAYREPASADRTAAGTAAAVYGQGDSFAGATPNQPSGSPSSQNLNVPLGLGIDPTGALYIADFENNRVLRYVRPTPTPPQNVAPQSLTITGDTTGEVNTAYRFTATVAPTDTTTPLTYTWQASQQQPITTTGNLSNQQQFTWDAAGTQQITVTAANALGVVTDTFSIRIQAPPTGGTTLTPDDPAVLTPTDTLLLQFPTGAVTSTTRITYTGTTAQTPPTSPTTQTLRRFTLAATDEQGAPVAGTLQAYTSTLTLTSDELEELGDDLSGLQVQRWNGSAWEVIASQPVTTTRQLAAGNAIQYQTSALGQFVLTAPVQNTTRRIYLPLIVRQQQ